MATSSDKTSRKRWRKLIRRYGFEFFLMLWAILIVVLTAAPIVASRYGHPWVGVAIAILALPTWVYLGPRPGPACLTGFLALHGIIILLAMLAIAVFIALRTSSAAG